MLEIFHSPGTRGFRVIWTCEEIGTPYKVVPVDFSVEYRATPQWRAMNPVGKVPVMRDGDLTIFESGAMVQHVLDKADAAHLQPAIGTADRAEYMQWCWFAESTFSRPLGEITNHKRAFAEPIEACMEEMRGRARVCIQALEAHLSDRAFLLNSGFSGADLMMGYSVRGFCRHCPDDPLPAHVDAYFARLRERPSWARASAVDVA
jgi:glutathione S-transferase